MTGVINGSDQGFYSGQTQIKIQNNTHPLAAGFTDITTTFTLSRSLSFGNPGGNAIKIADVVSNPGKWLIFGYDKDFQMVNMTAPARRVGLMLGVDGVNALNSSGWQLFESAITWAVTGN
jgi:hypothetical protein